MSNELIIDDFLDMYQTVVEDLKLKPNQIFNCDETGFTSKQKVRERAVGLKGNACFQEQPVTVDHVTVHMTVCANGKVLPTMVIYQNGLPHRSYKDDCPEDWFFATSTSGYMDRTLFSAWFEQVFLPNCG